MNKYKGLFNLIEEYEEELSKQKIKDLEEKYSKLSNEIYKLNKKIYNLENMIKCK